MNVIESIKWLCEDENGNFQITEVIEGLSLVALLPLSWVLLYALGCN